MSEANAQQSLFSDVPPSRAHFDGETYDPAQDRERLTNALDVVRQLVANGAWWTLEGLQWAAMSRYGKHITEAGISARLRDLRKPRFGSHTIQRRRHPNGEGLWQYRLHNESESQS